MKNSMFAFALMACALSSACGSGSETPVLSEVTMSQLEINYGDEFFASFEARDQDGDLQRATVKINMQGPEDDQEIDLEETVDATEVEVGANEVSMAVGMKLTGQFPLGVYQLEFRVTDDDGHESEPGKARVNLITGGGGVTAF